jgi:enoyl-CoA hydratase
MGDRIRREDADGLTTLTLTRADKLNALDTQTFEELAEHCAALEAEGDAIGCVVLRGEGRAFCAGADLKGFGTAQIDKRFKPGVIERLASLPQPTIAAVHGVCLTGGLELALACDFILADASARFADTHGTWGFVGEWGMTQRLPRRIGLAPAKRMMMTAREVAADEALAMGLVDSLAPLGGLDALVGGLAGEILANSRHTNFATKRLLRETDGMRIDDALSHEHYRNPGFAPDHQERIARFGKK